MNPCLNHKKNIINKQIKKSILRVYLIKEIF